MYEIRAAQPSDAMALQACFDAAYSVYRDRISDLPDVSAGLDQDIAENTVFVAVRDGQVIGGLVLILKSSFAVLANVAIHPQAAGLGVGRGLIAHSETHCRAHGIKELRLSTHVQMPENVALYERLGWQEAGRTANKVEMVKAL